MKGYQFDLKLWVLKYLIRFEPTGDFINSEEYREPDWLVKMKELKKKLAGKSGLGKAMNVRNQYFPRSLQEVQTSQWPGRG